MFVKQRLFFLSLQISQTITTTYIHKQSLQNHVISKKHADPVNILLKGDDRTAIHRKTMCFIKMKLVHGKYFKILLKSRAEFACHDQYTGSYTVRLGVGQNA